MLNTMLNKLHCGGKADLHGVLLSKHGSPEEDVRSLLERGLLEGPTLIPVDAMPGDGHEVASGGHAVAEDGQVAVVDVRAIELNHTPHLLHQGPSSCLNAQGLDDVWQVVAHSTGVVHSREAHHLQTKSPML